jgi:hypothetical protein
MQADTTAVKPKTKFTITPQVKLQPNEYKTTSKKIQEIKVAPTQTPHEYFPKLPGMDLKVTPASYKKTLSTVGNRQTILVHTPRGDLIPLNTLYTGGKPVGYGSLWP